MIVDTNTTTFEDGTTILKIAGRLHLGNSLMSVEHAIEDMIDGGVRKLIVDLSALDKADSAGVGMLIATAGRMEQAGGAFAVAGAHGVVAQSFGVVHLDRVVRLHPDVESARAALAGGGQSRINGA